MTFTLFVCKVSRVNAPHLAWDFSSLKNSSNELIERKLAEDYRGNVKEGSKHRLRKIMGKAPLEIYL